MKSPICTLTLIVFMANLLYLHQHQLIVSGLKPSSEGYVLVNRPAITHRGIDFIRDDGGLGAILNVANC
ncbi:Uncharacterised protein [Raoultella planticola]|nr:Uncharacterised protein [Raoultella planticola]